VQTAIPKTISALLLCWLRAVVEAINHSLIFARSVRISMVD